MTEADTSVYRGVYIQGAAPMTGKKVRLYFEPVPVARYLEAMAAASTADRIEPVPNKPKTPHTSIRIPPDLKAASQAKAKTEGRTLTDVIIAGLQDYTHDAGESA